MSRIPKWKVEKAKVKVVFRLQIHATNIPHPGWDKLFVSFIPIDTGKATAKTTKANVRNGSCKWSDPIYETTRFFQDVRNRKYDEKLYKLVVAMGSSRSSLLGEASINLADFADASKPSYVSLPLSCCDSGTILHVTVQLLSSKTGFREFEQQRELSVKSVQTVHGQRSHDPAVSAATLELKREQLEKGNNARVRFKEDSIELHSLEDAEESNEDYEDSAAGLDGSSNASEILYAEKLEISSTNELDIVKSTASGGISSTSAFQSPRIVKTDVRESQISKQGITDWTHEWSSDYSADNDLTTGYDENIRLRVRLEGAEAAFLQLNLEAKSLQSLCDELGAETNSLAKQLAAELTSSEKLTTEVDILKSECYTFKKELEELQSATAPHCLHGNVSSFHGTTTRQQANDLSTCQDSVSNHHQVKWLQGLLLLEDKVREIQNKACLGYHGRDFDFLCSDFDVLQCVLQNLKRETSLELGDETQLKEMRHSLSEHVIHGQDLQGSYLDQHHNPDNTHGLINSYPVKSDVDDTSILEEKMCELLRKLEESDVEKGILTKKMDHMECYYEALIQELEQSRHQMTNELANLTTEHSSCLYTISALQSQIEKLQQDMSEQFIRFAGDRQDLDSLNKEFEKRVIDSETALKRVRLNYAIAVDRLQKDLELLSFQVLSMYETNENLAKQAFIDASQLFPHQHPEEHPGELYKPVIAKFHSDSISRKTDYEKHMMVNGISEQASVGAVYNLDFNGENKNIFQKGLPGNVDLWTTDEGSACRNVLKVDSVETNPQIRSFQQGKVLDFQPEHRDKLCDISPVYESICDTQMLHVEANKQMLGDKFGPEDTRRSVHMLQKFQVETEADLSEMHMRNLHWEVYTEVLKEAMHRLNDGVLHMKEEIARLARQVDDSSSEKEQLMLKLDGAFDDIRKLRRDEVNCRCNCDDLMLKNHILEAKLEDVSREKISLSQEVTKYQSQWKTRLEERNEFEDKLKAENTQKSCLLSKISIMVEDFKALNVEYDSQLSANSELQKTLSYLQKKLGDLGNSAVSFSEEIDSFTIDGLSLKQDMENSNYEATVSYLEQFQQEACKKIHQLLHENEGIIKDRDIAHCSLNNTDSLILHLKQKFESELEEARMKLDLSNALVEKLQLELQDVADKLKFTVEAEEKHISTNKELSSKLTILEIEIQQANDENRDTAQKLLELDNANHELECTKISLMDCMQEKKNLMMSIYSEKAVSIQLENELRNLKEGLKRAHDNLHLERGSREELEATVTDLTLQLQEKGQQLLEFHTVKQELERTKTCLVDFTTENKTLMMSLDSEKIVSIQLENELRNLKEGLKRAHDNLHLERGSREELEATVTDLTLQLQEKGQQLLEFHNVKHELERTMETTVTDLTLQLQEKGQQLLEFHNVKQELERTETCLMDFTIENKTLMMSIESEKIASIQLENELTNLKDVVKCAHDNLQFERGSKEELEATVADLTLQLKEKDQQLLEFDNVKQEFERIKTRLMDCMQENKTLMVSMESEKVVSMQLENEISKLKDVLKCTQDNLQLERGSKQEVEDTVVDLTSQLNEKCQQLLSSHEQKSEMIFLRKRMADLETERQHLLINSKECQTKLDDQISTLHIQIADLEYYLADVLDQSLSADVKATYMTCLFQPRMEELVDQNKELVREVEELHLKHAHAATSLKDHIATEVQFYDENKRLSTAFHSVKAELEVIVREKEGLVEYINDKNSMLANFEDTEARAAMVEAENRSVRQKFEVEICKLRNMLVSLEEEVDNLRSSKLELETTEIILRSKLNEQRTHVSLLEECQRELKRSREQHSELTYKLSEQSLKTEEFRNLSIHLRELKDKAEVECLQARERKEAEGSSVAMQDSLRIAFIKEQCESKLQEMKNQFCASQKYAEEILLKLQTALDEGEIGKRREVSLAKRNEELSVKIAELQTVMNDMRELGKSYDRMKAELECSMLSLDCCKDEKLKLESSLQESNEERSRLRVELDLVKRLLQNMASSTAGVEAQNKLPNFHSSTSIGEILGDINFQPSLYQKVSHAATVCSDERTLTEDCEDPANNIHRDELEGMSPILSSSGGEVQHVPPAGGIGHCLPPPQHNLRELQAEPVRRSSVDKETLLENSTKHIADVKEHFKGQRRLLASMDLLHKELERLKNDNLSSIIPLEDVNLDHALQGLQSDVLQLDKANEHLESIFPIFKELPGSGNALERVLALELELAEALQEKKKDEHFQSTFLKQHNDDKAVFQSFRDINELIKDMLELKRRNAAVETELNEMQGRYSQLSLQFAEVEGERQLLVMTLKSRSPRKS